MKEKHISQLIGQSVYTLDNGQEVGYILNACFDDGLNKMIGVVVADDESERENFLQCHSIKIWGEESVFVEDATALEFNFAAPNNPVGKKVYDRFGNLLGRVLDISLEGNIVQNLLLATCQLPARAVSYCGVDCLFFNKKCSKNAKKIAKIDNFAANMLPKVQIDEEFSHAKIAPKPVPVKLESPQKVILTPKTLLNKTATADIVGLNNEIIIKKGQQINQSKIDKAKKHGKLNLLIINSK